MASTPAAITVFKYFSMAGNSWVKISVFKVIYPCNTPPMQKAHQVGQIRFGKIVHPHPRIEAIKAEM